jgi:DnaJ like chaperone protein
VLAAGNLVRLRAVDPLAWLGLREGADGNLLKIQAAVRDVLPEDREAVVVRYIVVVCILLTRVAYADGRVDGCELDHLRGLLRRVDRLPPEGIEAVCHTLHQLVPALSQDALKLCYCELRALCDAKERRQVMRLLAELARVDGTIGDAERQELECIAGQLGLGASDLGLDDELPG